MRFHGIFFWLMEQGFAGCFKGVVGLSINRVVGVSVVCSCLFVFCSLFFWGGEWGESCFATTCCFSRFVTTSIIV